VRKPDQGTAGPQSSSAASSNRAPSNQASSNPDADALSSLEGLVSIRNGIAASQDLKFLVAGAQAHLQGSFNLNNKDVHLTGDMAMQADISHATTGFKSFLLKPLAPFLRKKNAGAVVPIAVTGRPGHYKVTSDFFHDK
jgi:hypothetical protein